MNDQSALIIRGVLSLARRLRSARPAGSVSLASVGILSTLWRLGPMPAVRLAAEEGLQPQSLTRLIHALERGGLIDRTQSKTDGREIVISVTPHGLEVLRADLDARRRWLEEAMSTMLTETERGLLLEASEAMVKLSGADSGQSSEGLEGASRGGITHDPANHGARGDTN